MDIKGGMGGAGHPSIGEVGCKMMQMQRCPKVGALA